MSIKNKIYILLFSIFHLMFFCKKKNSQVEELVLLWYLLNQSSLRIHCEDIPANQIKTSVPALTTENCSLPSDPLYPNQWHFNNSGEDIRIGTTWQSYCGTGVKVAIIDDGLEINHEDLSSNIEIGKSYDYVDKDSDPTGNPAQDDSMHGTAVAGLIAAKDNSIGVRGVAPRASLRAYDAIKTGISSDIIDATIRDISNIWISNNSWGPQDGTGLLQDSSELWKNSIEDGLMNGRLGLGTIYLFAAGNGQYVKYNSNSYLTDNSNYDGYTNYHGVLSICAIGKDGKQANYSERGANLWVCAPSMGNDQVGLITTDLSSTNGLNTKYIATYGSDISNTTYTQNFNGTSGSTPIVSGVIALMLQANPLLTWRDVRYILAQTARKNDPTDPDWTMNAGGFSINHKYGFGAIDASQSVNTSKNWNSLGNYRKCTIQNIPAYSPIEDNGTTLIQKFDTSFTGITKIEWVDVSVHLQHDYFGDLSIQLYSPSGTQAILAEPHNCFLNGQPSGCNTGNISWRFGIARFLDETAIGNFRLEITDKLPQDSGTLHTWDLTIYGREK